MTKTTNREIRLASRPNGLPAKVNFSIVTNELPPLQDQQVLVRNLFMSVDPYMRGRHFHTHSCFGYYLRGAGRKDFR